jgi:mersacidin/lichenicidin family type 2 lantibiotic
MMDAIRAWKDPEYRGALSNDQRARIPANPAGSLELTDEELSGIAGGRFTTAACGVVTTTLASNQYRCITFNNTVCHGTCGAFGTQGCCGGGDPGG